MTNLIKKKKKGAPTGAQKGADRGIKRCPPPDQSNGAPFCAPVGAGLIPSDQGLEMESPIPEELLCQPRLYGKLDELPLPFGWHLGSIRPDCSIHLHCIIEVFFLSSERKAFPLSPRNLKQVISSSWLSILFMKNCYKCQLLWIKTFKKRYTSTRLDLRITNSVNSIVW